MSDTPKLRLANSFDEPTVAEVVVWLREQGAGENDWICHYPEFADPGCLEAHDPEQTRQPRKHQQCAWHLVVPLDTEPPKKEEK